MFGAVEMIVTPEECVLIIKAVELCREKNGEYNGNINSLYAVEQGMRNNLVGIHKWRAVDFNKSEI